MSKLFLPALVLFTVISVQAQQMYNESSRKKVGSVDIVVIGVIDTDKVGQVYTPDGQSETMDDYYEVADVSLIDFAPQQVDIEREDSEVVQVEILTEQISASEQENEDQDADKDTGIEKLLRLEASPNPAYATLMIKMYNANAPELSLYTLCGREVMRCYAENNGFASLDLSGLSEGLYLLSLVDGTQKQTQLIQVLK